MFYYFKNKNNILAKLSKTIYGFHIEETYVQLNSVLGMLINDSRFNSWISCRKTSIAREFADSLYRTGDIHNNYDFVDITMCLSLKDTFWVCKCDDNKTWDSVSLFSNSFSKTFTDIASGLKGYTGKTIKTPSPEFSVAGCSCKFFRRYSNEIFLYKTFGGLAELQFIGAYNEYFVSQLLKALGLANFVNYDLVNYNNKILSKCKLITSDNIGMIDIKDLCNDAQHLEEHIKHYNGSALVNFKNMLIVDCLVLNVDRHDENIAMLFNADSLQLIDLAPMYDFDHSLLYNISLTYNSVQFIKEHILSLSPRTYHSHTFEDQFKFCMSKDMYMRLLSIKNFKFKNHDKYPINNKRLEILNKAFRWNYNRLMRSLGDYNE